MKKRDTLLNTYFRVLQFESLLRKIFHAQLRNLGARLDKFAIRYRNDQNLVYLVKLGWLHIQYQKVPWKLRMKTKRRAGY